MKEKAKISIIVPVYNVETFLRKCIESLQKQTLKEIQIILVDDGSNDASGEIIDEYAETDARIIVVHKKNGGISSARNEGLRYVNAEFLTFVDADDWVDEKMYTSMYDAAIQTGADIVSTDIKLDEMVIYKECIISKYLLKGDVSCCNKIFRMTKEIQEEFSFDAHNVSIDVKGCYDLFKYCKIWTVIPGAFYNYRQDNLSYGRSGFNKNDLNCVEMTLAVATDVKKNYPEAYDLALNHVVHAKYDIIGKVANFGFRNQEAENEFRFIYKDYLKDIRRRLPKSLKTSYFNLTEKIQMIILACSYNAYIRLKRIWLKRTATSKVNSHKI